MPTKQRAIIIAAITIMGLGAWLLPGPPAEQPKERIPQPEPSDLNASAMGPAAALPAQFINDMVLGAEPAGELPDTFFANLPRSLAGTGRPAPLSQDESGRLIADIRLRRLFDYYLSAIGEEPLEQIVARIRDDLRQQLTAEDFENALAILEGYLQYRNGIGNLVKSYNAQFSTENPANLGQLLDAKRMMNEMRGDYLAPEVVKAFFGAEDAYDNFMLSRAAILSNTALSASEKNAALQLLGSESPPNMVAARQRNQAVASLQESESALIKSGATEEAIYALRANKVGPEAAERLAELDRQKARWEGRLDTYRRELRVIEADAQYPESERNRLINELRQQHFSEQESARVQALDRIRTAN